MQTWRLRHNIDLVQINLNNNDGKFYIPENVDFRDKRINNVMLLGSADVGESSVSPFDGRTLVVMTIEQLYGRVLYRTIKVLFENVCGEVLQPYSNLKFAINSAVSLNYRQSHTQSTDNLTNKCILLYVSYSGGECDPILPTNSITIRVTIPHGSKGVKLSDYVDEYIKQQNKFVKAIETDCDFDYYLTLQDRKHRVFRFVPSNMFRSDYSLVRKNQHYGG